jgi:UDP-2,4-diacetamido-2,4,6-trideoxy-beta-L-altropyranose hydrolase
MEGSTLPFLAIRADADSTIGAGHVMRCLALAQAATDLGINTLFIGRIEAALAARLHEEDFTVLQSPEGEEEDLKHFLEATSQCKAVVIDHYELCTSYQREVRRAGLRLLVIDDYNHHEAYEADLLLNQNPGAEAYDYLLPSGAELLLGPQFALLRREFRSPVEDDGATKLQGPLLLVTMGGADPDNISALALEALMLPEAEHIHAKILLGASNPHREALTLGAQALGGRVVLENFTQNMALEYSRADMVLSGGGSTCLEICAMAKPALAIVLAENQKGTCRNLHEMGALQCLGPADGLNPQKLASALGALWADEEGRKLLSQRGSQLLDGKGALRVVRRLLQIPEA